MAALTCDICGGKLTGKAGGVFECDSCGMEYDTSWAKQKIQEIKGTVQVENMASRDSLLKRGQLLLEDGEWAEADSYFVKVLDIDPECAEAYLGKLMAELRCSTKSSLLKLSIAFDSSKNYEKVIRFGDAALKAELEDYNACIHERNAKRYKADAERLEVIRQRIRPAMGRMCVGDNHIVGLKADGRVVAAGWNHAGQCNVSGWCDIVAIAASGKHTIGLKSNGTVVAVGDNCHGQCDVSDWTDIVAVATSGCHTVGLKADGTVVAVGCVDERCDVSDWTDIVAVAAGNCHTVGLKANGTIVAVGSWGKYNVVPCWNDIVAVAAGFNITVGLKSNGAVVAFGDEYKGRCDVSHWTDIVAIEACSSYIFGLTSVGRVVEVFGYTGAMYPYGVSKWSDIVAVAAGFNAVVGLKLNGTVVVANKGHQFDVTNWKLFNSLDTLARAREEARIAEVVRREAQETRRITLVENLEKEKASLEAELPRLKGLFSGGKRKQIEARLAEVENELKGLQ